MASYAQTNDLGIRGSHEWRTTMRRCQLPLILLLALWFVASSASGEYILSVQSETGESFLTVDPGDSFNLNLWLESDESEGSDESITAIFDVVFSLPGLTYESYGWSGLYVTGGPDDVSKPSGSFPYTISDTTYEDPLDVGAIDIHLENFLPSPYTFSEGLLAQLTLAAPAAYWSGGGIVTIQTDPLATGFLRATLPVHYIPTGPGDPFELTVTPEPTTTVLALLGLGFGGLFARRRRKARP